MVGGPASADDAAPAAPPMRVRATVDQINGDKLELTSRTGEKLAATLKPDTRFSAITVAPIDQIKPGSFIGTTAVPQADGTLKALEVHVFPEAMRGAGEGHYPWDRGGKNSTMTNGTVGSVVGTKGRTMTVDYKGGERQIVVPDDVPIVTFEPGDRSLVTKGAHVMAFVSKAADGTLLIDGLSVGKNGLTPPM
jgi:hypothetical protein